MLVKCDVDDASEVGVVNDAIDGSRFTSIGSSGSGDGSWSKAARSSSYRFLRLGQRVQTTEGEISHMPSAFYHREPWFY